MRSKNTTNSRTSSSRSADLHSTPSRIAFGALVASAAFSGMTADLRASELDARLRVIHDALRPRVALPHHAQAASSRAKQGSTIPFNIPRGSLREVADAVAHQTGVRISFANESLGTIDSPGVVGVMTLDEALNAMIAGTNVSLRALTATSFVLDLPSVNESVSVTGEAAILASPKYTAPLRDIPQTIEVIPQEAMAAQGVTTLSEALRNVPGITMQAGEGGGASSTAGDMFNMRGFNASNSLFVDNVRDDGLVSRDVFNIEQVEVFMGPTGTDVGRGTAAGYVNMKTKTPSLPGSGSGTLALGAAEQRRATIDVNHSIPSRNPDSWIGKSAVRLNAVWQDSGVAGRDEVTNATKAIAPSVALGLSTPTRVIAAAQILRQDNLPDYGIPGAAWPESQLAPTGPQASKPVDQGNYYGSPAFDYDRAEQNSFTARIERDLNPLWTISNQTRYNETSRDAIISTIQNPAAFNPVTEMVAIARQGNIRENNITSNQTALAGRRRTGSLDHSLTAGLEFTSEGQFAPALGGVGTRAAVSIYSPNPNDPVTGFAPARTAAFTDGNTNTAAIYAFDSVTMGPRVRVNAGLRFEHYGTKYKSVDASNATTVDTSAGDGLFSGKTGIVYSLRSNANVYASYGTTVTPPGSANFALSSAANNVNNPNVEPQESANLEFGTKVDVAGGRLSLTGAMFHTVNRNVIFTVDAAAVPPVYNQDDEQRVNGVALGMTGQITPEWSVLGSFGYLDAVAVSQGEATNGKRLQLTPEFSGSVWSTYQLPRRISVGGGVRATSEAFINAANTIVTPGFYVVDGLVEYAVNQHLTLRLNIYNVTDAVYIRSVNNNGGRYNPGLPRTAQLTTAFSF